MNLYLKTIKKMIIQLYVIEMPLQPVMLEEIIKLNGRNNEK